MPEVVMCGGVQLDQSVVGAIDIGEEETAGRLARQVADVGNGRLKLRAGVDLLLIPDFRFE